MKIEEKDEDSTEEMKNKLTKDPDSSKYLRLKLWSIAPKMKLDSSKYSKLKLWSIAPLKMETMIDQFIALKC